MQDRNLGIVVKLVGFLCLNLLLLPFLSKAQGPDERLLANVLARRTIIHRNTLILSYVAGKEKAVKVDLLGIPDNPAQQIYRADDHSLLGVVIGVIVIAMYLPLFKLGQNF